MPSCTRRGSGPPAPRRRGRTARPPDIRWAVMACRPPGAQDHWDAWVERGQVAEPLPGQRPEGPGGRPPAAVGVGGLGHDERMAMAAAATSERDAGRPGGDLDLLRAGPAAVGRRASRCRCRSCGASCAAMDIRLDRVRGWLNRRDDPVLGPGARRLRPVPQPAGTSPGPVGRREDVHPGQGTQAPRPGSSLPGRAAPAGVRVHPPRHRQPGRRPRRAQRHGRRPGPSSGTTPRTSAPSSTPSTRASTPTSPSTSILDNGSSHVSKETKAWFAAHPRWVVHYTPPHASWVNQIELFFSILQRKVVRNGNFTSPRGPHRQAARLHQRPAGTGKPGRQATGAPGTAGRSR